MTNKKPITIYSKNFCQSCKMAKMILNQQGLDFNLVEEINLDEHPELIEQVKAETGLSSMPIVIAEGFEPFGGFIPDKLKQVAASF